jgi:hypothetical protein
LKPSSSRTAPAEGSLLILAVDMTGDRSLRDYDFEDGDAEVVADPLIFLRAARLADRDPATGRTKPRCDRRPHWS